MSPTQVPLLLIVKYLVVFTAFGLGIAVYLAATASALAATLVLVASLESGLMLAGLAAKQQRTAAMDDVVLMAKSADLGVRKLPGDVAE